MGWSTLLVALSLLMEAVLGSSGPALSADSKAVVNLILGLVMVSFGLRRLIGARHPLQPALTGGEQHPSAPKWMQAIDDLSFVKAFGFGFVLLAASPANIAVYLSSMQGLAGVGLGNGRVALTIVLIFAIDLCILIPLAVYLAFPKRASTLLENGKQWLLRHQQALVSWVLSVFGLLLTISSVLQLV